MVLSPGCDSMKFTSMSMNPFPSPLLFLSATQRNDAPVNFVTRWLLLYLVATATELYLVEFSQMLHLLTLIKHRKE